MLNKIFVYAILAINVLLLCNCKSDSSDFFRPESSGRSGEILLVMSDRMWDSEIGDTMAAWLAQEVLVLPQYEPTFKIIRITPSANKDFFKKARNVIDVDVNPNYKRTEFRVESDKNSRPQIYITLRAPNDSIFLKSWYNVQTYVRDTIIAAEQSRYLYGFRKHPNTEAQKSIKKTHNVSMLVPTSGFNVDVNKEDFVWISKETQISSQGILLFKFDYKGPDDFKLENLVKRIDSVLMNNVPGDKDGSFMAIEKKLPPLKKEFSKDGNYVCELRGLWETEGDFMGGPFVSQSMVDTQNNKLVTAFSYVYGGKKDKRNLMWQLEAIMLTFKTNYQND